MNLDVTRHRLGPGPADGRGRRLALDCSDALLGRVVDPLGRPLDGGPPVPPGTPWPMEARSPAIVERDFVSRPLYTGNTIIDTLLPIGRGQRELLIGDDGTGKSALAHTAVVVSEAGSLAGLQYLAPFAGCALAESWMHAGHPDRLRRPRQARAGLPRAVAAAAPPTGARGLSRRHLLPAFAAAGALHPAECGAGRRQHDGAADRADPARRGRQLHPDQPDLDHRRAGLPQQQALRGRDAPGDGAERGFCGAHNSHLAQSVRDLRSADPGTCFWLASRRLQTLLEDLPGAAPLPLAACAAIEEAEDTLDAWWAALDPVLAACRALWLLYPDESGVVRRRLWPPEPPAPSAPSRSASAPMHYLPLPVLTGALTRQLLQLRLRTALLAALAQENHARQAQITDELETLMSAIGA